MESDYQIGNTQISEYVTFNLKENIDKIDAYLNSKHVSGETDSQGREKPFFNIVTAAVNIWFRATDLDRKNIKIKATKSGDYTLALLATIHLQEWMRRFTFGAFLNDWGRSLARYGSSVVKFIEQDGELHCEVIPWNRLICDTIDFDNNVKIEKLYFTPAQLRKKKGYNKDVVEQLIEDATTTRKGLNKINKDTKSEFIEVYEVHGELPLSYLTNDDEDDDVYQQQMHVISFMATNVKGEYDDYSLFSGRETKDPYMITHLIKEDGRTQSIGAVEHLFEAQWMMNHTIKQIKDQLDLASKQIFQTSDGNFVGRNLLSSLQNGDIMIHAPNMPLTQANNSSHDIASLQNFGQQWKSLGNEINGISEAMMGANPPSGSAWRQTQAMLQESHSLFELMTENKGLHVVDMLTTYIVPFIKKQMDTSEEISATLEAYQIKHIDSRYVPAEAVKIHNQMIKNEVLNGRIAQQPDINALKQSLQDAQNAFGNQRFISPDEISTKTWKTVLKDIEWEFEYEITNEQTDKQAVMDTLNTTLKVMMDPTFDTNPRAKMVVDKILNETGVVSPLELSMENKSPAAPPVGQPAVSGGVGAGQLPSNQPAMAMQ